MTTTEPTEFEAALASAEQEVGRIRQENKQLAEVFRSDPTDARREQLRRAAGSLSAARDRVEAARVTLEIVRKTGSPYGLLADHGRVVGTFALMIAAGKSSKERADIIHAEVAAPLADAAQQLGVVLAAAPHRYCQERQGRDEEGRTIVDVAGRVEGDLLVPQK